MKIFFVYNYIFSAGNTEINRTLTSALQNFDDSIKKTIKSMETFWKDTPKAVDLNYIQEYRAGKIQLVDAYKNVTSCVMGTTSPVRRVKVTLLVTLVTYRRLDPVKTVASFGMIISKDAKVLAVLVSRKIPNCNLADFYNAEIQRNSQISN